MDVCVARQPIFDRRQKIFAFELLFRSTLTDNFYDGVDGDRATSAVLSNSFLTIGMSTVTGGKRAFINFTHNLLVKEVVTIFPKDLVAVEILEDVEPTEEVIAACKRLKERGYVIVLDDFVLQESRHPLTELADIIKIDFLKTQGSERADILKKINSPKVKFLAEKVETIEDYHQAVELGYSYFQGYFFSKPVLVPGRDVPGFKQNYIRLLKELASPDADFERLETFIKQDVAIAYKLLNYINSAYFNFPQRIESIKHTLALLGLNEARKCLMVFALSYISSDKSEALIVTSLTRANFCEMIAPKINLLRRALDMFFLGLFSMIDALLDRPLAEILETLAIPRDIKDTLLGHDTLFTAAYELILFYEHGDWQRYEAVRQSLNLSDSDIPNLFMEAIEKTQALLAFQK
jgi:EAL and modified HD-GYP domain-containing signal transduction protein